MFDIMKRNNALTSNADWDDMWRTMDAMMQYPFGKNTIETKGLKSIINRPHNIVNVKDKDGKIVAQKLEVVTTPFAKGDVRVEVSDNILTVNCGSKQVEPETTKTEETTEYVYRGISSQTYTFSLKLNSKIDKIGIKAKNVDGILTITLPFKKEETQPETSQITVE